MNHTMKLTPKTHKQFLKSKGLPETVCFAPYMNMDLDQTGEMLTCFRGKQMIGNWKNKDITTQYNHQDFVQIRKDLFEGRNNKNCSVCQNREEKGLQSIRYNFTKDAYNSSIFDQIVEHIKKDHTKARLEDLLFVEVRPHNLCNLECMHCNQLSSSKWTRTVKQNPDLKDLYGSVFGGHEDVVDNNPHISIGDPACLEKLFKEAPNLTKVHFTGGEPLLDKTHDSWLRIIPNKKNVNLSYHSNLQHKLYKKLFRYWGWFKSVKIYNSWDACERLYPYFRYRGEFDSLEENLQSIKDSCNNVELRGTLTVNLFSLFDFHDHIRLWGKYNMKPHYSFVEHTHPMSIVYLPKDIKVTLLDKAYECAATIESNIMKDEVVKMINEIEKFANQFDYKHLNNKTREYILHLDRIRNTDINEVCPELREYFKGD